MVTWIFAGGAVQEEFLAAYERTHKAECIIAVDGGLASVDRLSCMPTHIVGDFDTVDSSMLARYEGREGVSIRRFQPEKDLTDSQIAVELALELGSTQIVIFGATGTRLDHVLGNLYLLAMGVGKQVSMEILDANNRIHLLECGLHSIWRREQYGKYVSLLPFTDSVEGITLRGFRYPLTDYRMDRFQTPTIGISNELVEECGTVEVKQGIVFCIESKD